jgi:hypothetical protein
MCMAPVSERKLHMCYEQRESTGSSVAKRSMNSLPSYPEKVFSPPST